MFLHGKANGYIVSPIIFVLALSFAKYSLYILLFYFMFMSILSKVCYWWPSINHDIVLFLLVTHNHFFIFDIFCIVRCLLLYCHVSTLFVVMVFC